MFDKYYWLLYVVLAGLAWGTYVPIIFYGGRPNARLLAILCVGLAYFVIGVLFPLGMFLSGQQPWPELKMNGLVFSGLAGIAGAVGAICVIFATQSAMGAARAAELDPGTFKVFIAPLIFGLAPVINVLVSTVWHPQADDPFHFSFKSPHPILWLGILFVAVGAALVLYSKELSETAHKAAPPKAPEVPVTAIKAID